MNITASSLSVFRASRKAAEEDLSPLDYMRRYGAFEVKKEVYELYRNPLSEEQLKGTKLMKKTVRF